MVGVVPRVRTSSIVVYKGISVSEEALVWLLTICASLSSGISGVIELFVGVLFANYIMFPLLQKDRLVPFPAIVTNFIIYCASSPDESRGRNISEDSSSPFMLDGGYFGRHFGSFESSPAPTVSQAHVEELMVGKIGLHMIHRILALVVMNVNMLC